MISHKQLIPGRFVLLIFRSAVIWQEGAERLVQVASGRGSSDNITALVIDLREQQWQAAATVEVAAGGVGPS